MYEDKGKVVMYDLPKCLNVILERERNQDSKLEEYMRDEEKCINFS